MTRLPYAVDEAGCWIWAGSRNAGGYGTTTRRGSGRLAHRVVYEDHIGPIPEGLTLDHLCRVKECVNPAHLEPVTLAENIQRASRLRTACKRGHAFDDPNTYRARITGRRVCRSCHREREAARKRSAGVPPATRYTPETIARMRAMRDDGQSLRVIAGALGLNPGSVHRALQRYAA